MFWNCLGAWWFELFFSSWDDGCLGTSFSDWSMERILARSAPRRAPWVPGIWKGFEEGPDAASCPSSFRFIDSTLLSIRILFCKQWEYHVASKRGPFGEDFLHLFDIYICVYTLFAQPPTANLIHEGLRYPHMGVIPAPTPNQPLAVSLETTSLPGRAKLFFFCVLDFYISVKIQRPLMRFSVFVMFGSGTLHTVIHTAILFFGVPLAFMHLHSHGCRCLLLAGCSCTTRAMQEIRERKQAESWSVESPIFFSVFIKHSRTGELEVALNTVSLTSWTRKAAWWFHFFP